MSFGLLTVFAPTDEAFVELLGPDPEAALATLDVATLQDLLLYHTVNGTRYTSTTTACGAVITMANDETTKM